MNENRINVNLNQCKTLKCDHCASIYFTSVTVIKSIPAMLVGKKGELIFLTLWMCIDCKKILDDINPIKDETENGEE